MLPASEIEIPRRYSLGIAWFLLKARTKIGLNFSLGVLHASNGTTMARDLVLLGLDLRSHWSVQQRGVLYLERFKGRVSSNAARLRPHSGGKHSALVSQL